MRAGCDQRALGAGRAGGRGAPAILPCTWRGGRCSCPSPPPAFASLRIRGAWEQTAGLLKYSVLRLEGFAKPDPVGQTELLDAGAIQRKALQGKTDDLLQQLTKLAGQRLKAQSTKGIGEYLKASGKFLIEVAAKAGIEVLVKQYTGAG